MPLTSIYLASLELDVVQQGDDLQSRILYPLYYRPNGLKWMDFGDQQVTIECPERACFPVFLLLTLLIMHLDQYIF